MIIRLIAIVCALVLLASTAAFASSFDGMTAEQVRAHPDFVADTYSLSSAMNSGDADADNIYWWIGYIPDGEKRVYFTSFGEPLTCVKWDVTGEWVPEWVLEALSRLYDEGYIKIEGK